jgi:NinB protein
MSAIRTIVLPKLKPRDLAICAIVDKLEDLPISEGFRVEIHAHKSTRSGKQNRTLWWIYDKILEYGGEAMGGWRREDLHEFMLCLHFGAEVREMGGKKLRVPSRRSSKLSKIEFAELVEHIYQFMAEQGVVLPQPDPEMAMEFDDEKAEAA